MSYFADLLPAQITEAPDKWMTAVPVGIAIFLALWQFTFRYGELEMALGSYALLFWLLA